MRAEEDDWIVLSNRLLLLQEIMVGLSAYPPDGVIGRAAEGVGWIFDGGTLRRYRPGELSPTPPVTRGRGRVGDLVETRIELEVLATAEIAVEQRLVTEHADLRAHQVGLVGQ